MLFQRADSLSKGGFTLENYLNIADALCHSSMEVSPVFECVKVFARIDEHGDFVYARHKHDLGTSNIDRHQISERIKDSNRRKAVLNALYEVEESCHSIWPFAQGSATWILLEILHPEIKLASVGNKPTVIFRTANRISSKGSLSETALIKSLFSQFQNALSEVSGNYLFSFNPTVRLNNISGSGVYTKFRDEHNTIVSMTGESNVKLADLPASLKENYENQLHDLFTSLLERNFSLEIDKNPGFMFILDEQLFKVQGKTFEAKRRNATAEAKPKRKMLSLPFGFRR